MSRITAGVVAAAVVLAVMVGTPGFVSAASINASPNPVAPGGDVELSGDVLADGTPGCEVPGPVTLISDAFAGLEEFAGVRHRLGHIGKVVARDLHPFSSGQSVRLDDKEPVEAD